MKKLIVLSALLVAGATTVLAQTAPPPEPSTPRVDKREARQQKRIAQGQASGQLTAKESARLKAQQDRVVSAEARAKSDGKVTAKERARLDRKQDRASRNVYRQKHDAQKQ